MRATIEAYEACLKKRNESVKPQLEELSAKIKQRDEKLSEICKKIKAKTASMLKDRKLSRDQKIKIMREVQSLYVEADKLSMEKVNIAEKLYDSLDHNIRELDTHRLKFEAELKRRGHLTTPRSPEEKKRRKRKSEKTAGDGASGSGVMDTLNGPIAIDPSEPRYCFCNRVSFGEMVACDNELCPLEWFHFQCVGLTEAPKGTWYCSQCRDGSSKSRKKK